MNAKIIFTSFILFSFILFGVYLGGTSSELEQAKANIISLIQQNNFTEALAQSQKLVADFAGHADLPETLYVIARECECRLKLEAEDNIDVPDANSIYQQIIQDYPDSLYASKAELCIARTEVISLILYKNYDCAKEAFAQLIADFPEHPDLPETLCDVAERYEWSSKFEEAKSIYRQIIQDYPDTSWASKAELGISRAEVLSLILLRNEESYNLAEEALDKLIADFSGHLDFSKTLYWITIRYEWFSKFEQATGIYQQIIQDYPDSMYASKAELGISRSNVMYLINILEDFEQAQEAFDKMFADFIDYPDLQQTLCWIAERYEWLNMYEDAKSVYLQAAQYNPDSSYGRKAQLCASKIDFFFIDLQDPNGANEALDKMIADFNDHPGLSWALHRTAEEYYNRALLLEKEGLSEQAKANLTRALLFWDKIITYLPESSLSIIQHSYYFSASCYRKLGEHESAIEYFQEVVDNWPNYMYAWSAQSLIGLCYEKLLKPGDISESEAKPLIEQAYKAVIENYPDCSLVRNAYHKLGHIYYDKGQLSVAAMYFELFLEKTPETSQRGRAHVLYDLGGTYEQMGELNLAIETYGKFLDIAIDSARLYDPRIKTAKNKVEELKGQIK